MKTTGKGIVIREQTVGESDRLVTLLTDNFGLIKAFVRRAKRISSAEVSGTTMFAYSTFTLYKNKNNTYTISNASPIDVFFDLRKNLSSLSLAQYFAQLILEFGHEEQASHEMLRLFLNALHLLCAEAPARDKIKAVFELRLMCLGGYMPDIVACHTCAAYETDTMYFDTHAAVIYCENCGRGRGLVPLPLSVLTAVRFICLSDLKKVFSFKLSAANMRLLCACTEQFVLQRVSYDLSALKFYKEIKDE